MDAIDKINYILAKKGMSGAELEREIGVSNSVYSQWNTKTTKPSKKSLLKVAKVLDVDIIEILPDKTEQKEKPAPNGDELSDIQKEAVNFIKKLSPDQLSRFIKMGEAAFSKEGGKNE